MKLSRLIAAYGDEQVQLQNLDQCLIRANMKGSTTEITFGTSMPITPDKTEKLGFIVWLDRDRVAELTCASKSEGR